MRRSLLIVLLVVQGCAHRGPAPDWRAPSPFPEDRLTGTYLDPEVEAVEELRLRASGAIDHPVYRRYIEGRLSELLEDR